MTKYLDSPLKITGILLTFAGLISMFVTIHPTLPEGYSISLMGITVLLTAWLITRLPINVRTRTLFEIALVLVIFVSSALLALDYYGLISLHHIQAN